MLRPRHAGSLVIGITFTAFIVVTVALGHPITLVYLPFPIVMLILAYRAPWSWVGSRRRGNADGSGSGGVFGSSSGGADGGGHPDPSPSHGGGWGGGGSSDGGGGGGGGD